MQLESLHQCPALCISGDNWKTLTVEPVQGIEIGAKKGVARTKRLRRLFSIARPGPHYHQHRTRSLKKRCEQRPPESRASKTLETRARKGRRSDSTRTSFLRNNPPENVPWGGTMNVGVGEEARREVQKQIAELEIHIGEL